MEEQFKPIETQEQFDSMIKSRLEREANKVRGEFADYESVKEELGKKTKEAEELTAKIGSLEGQITELNRKVSASETASAKTRIAHEIGLPFELTDRITGETEEAIRADATKLKELFGAGQYRTPMFNPEPPAADTKDVGFRQMAKEIFNV